jgi:hypothetical protein
MDMKDMVTLESILAPLEPRESLCNQILMRVAIARQRAARMRLAVQAFLCFGFGAALVPLAQYTGHELFNSGFYDFASMIFADKALSILSWQEVAYSLIESLPSDAILLIFACTAALFWSLRGAVRNSRIAFSPQL